MIIIWPPGGNILAGGRGSCLDLGWLLADGVCDCWSWDVFGHFLRGQRSLSHQVMTFLYHAMRFDGLSPGEEASAKWVPCSDPATVWSAVCVVTKFDSAISTASSPGADPISENLIFAHPKAQLLSCDKFCCQSKWNRVTSLASLTPSAVTFSQAFPEGRKDLLPNSYHPSWTPLTVPTVVPW